MFSFQRTINWINKSYTMCVTKTVQLITRNSKNVKPTQITAEAIPLGLVQQTHSNRSSRWHSKTDWKSDTYKQHSHPHWSVKHHSHIYTHIYIQRYVCVCMCVRLVHRFSSFNHQCLNYLYISFAFTVFPYKKHNWPYSLGKGMIKSTC